MAVNLYTEGVWDFKSCFSEIYCIYFHAICLICVSFPSKVFGGIAPPKTLLGKLTGVQQTQIHCRPPHHYPLLESQVPMILVYFSLLETKVCKKISSFCLYNVKSLAYISLVLTDLYTKFVLIFLLFHPPVLF